MPVHKRKYESGKTVCFYQFDAPGSTRTTRRVYKGSGYATKQAAVDAESARRIEEQQKDTMAKAGATGVSAAVPATLGALLNEYLRHYAEEKLAPKTTEGYRDLITYLALDLLAMPLVEITPLHLNREWSRLLKCGGRTSKKKTRPLGASSVKHVARFLSTAFNRAIRWGLITSNPIKYSDPPVPHKHQGLALTMAQQTLVMEAAGTTYGFWCMRPFLEFAVATGCRRGELLALRWSDIADGRITLARSLTQTRAGLAFKNTKTNKPRCIKIPESLLAVLEAHRKKQARFVEQYGADYQPGDLVFADTDGRPLKPSVVSSSVAYLFERLKLPAGISLHSLRHTHTSELLADGVPLPVVSARLGHSSIRTTLEVYAHMIHGQDDDAADRWDEYHKRNQPATGDTKGQVQ